MFSQKKTFLALSLLLATLVTLVSLIALLTPDFYSKETLNWRVQSVGQDVIDLFLVVPCLIVTSILVYRRSGLSTFAWGGVVLYLLYTFVIYCFDVHFNRLFIIYCIILGLSFYSFLYFLWVHVKPFASDFKLTTSGKFIGIYFISIAVMFYVLWLSEILPAILSNTIPENLIETGLPTNAVHVLDLSVILPGIILTGFLILRRNSMAHAFVPVFLVFFILMDITIGFLVLMMNRQGIEADASVTFIMSALALLSLLLLIWFSNQHKNDTR